MSQVTKVVPFSQASSRDTLSGICKEGVERMLAVALEAEISDFLQRFGNRNRPGCRSRALS